jgi:hypothetical protein
MPLYEKKEGRAVLLWVLELRGRGVWTREGKSGGKGRLACVEHRTEAEAASAMEKLVADRLSQGYVQTHPSMGVSGPFASMARIRKAGARSGGFDPGELARKLEAALAGRGRRSSGTRCSGGACACAERRGCATSGRLPEGAARWINKAPPAARSGGGAVDQ